jgi:hypothetical protein
MELLVRKAERRLRKDLRVELDDMVCDQAPRVNASSASLKLFEKKVDNIVEEQRDKVQKRLKDLEENFKKLEKAQKDSNENLEKDLNLKMDKLVKETAEKVITEEINKVAATTREALKDDIKVQAYEESRLRGEKLRADIDGRLEELSTEFDEKIQEQIVEYMQKIQDELDDEPDPLPNAATGAVKGDELNEQLQQSIKESQEKLRKKMENYVDDIFVVRDTKLKDECLEEFKQKMAEDLDARDSTLLRKMIQMELKNGDDLEKVIILFSQIWF